MISNIQVLRGLAALGVAFYHTGFTFFGKHTHFQGVAIFFVISGFIMTYITRENADGFLRHRLIRIVPLYWLATLLLHFWFSFGFGDFLTRFSLIAEWLVQQDFPKLSWWLSTHHGLTEARLGELAKSLLFIPYTNSQGRMEPVLAVGWTLNLEMFYYVLFALMLPVSRKFAPLLVCAVLIAMQQLVQHQIVTNPVFAFYAGIETYSNFFIAGVAAYYLWQAIQQWMTPSIAVAIALVSLFWMAEWHIFGPHAKTPDVAFVAMVTLVVVAALALHSAKLQCNWRLPLVLGNASYALYLMHPHVMETFRVMAHVHPWWPATDTWIGMLASILTSCALAIAVFHWFEAPSIRLLRRLTTRAGEDAKRQFIS